MVDLVFDLVSDLVTAMLGGDRRALARMITLVENGAPQARRLLEETYSHTGRSYVMGVTGPPGAGKSTLVDAMTRAWRAAGRTVGIIAVDPTSPFTGGAILGDRVRMRNVAMDPGVFIRSLATRGHLGGLSRATADVKKLLDAFGFDLILVETVGAGQAEVEVAGLADTTLVVLAPGMGDDVQAIKAGILEIGEVFAINKADREGADRAVMEIETMLDMAPRRGAGGWRPPVVRTAAIDGSGVDQLVAALEGHRRHITLSGELAAKRGAQAGAELGEIVLAGAGSRIMGRARDSRLYRDLLDRVVRREVDPYAAADAILAEFGDARQEV